MWKKGDFLTVDDLSYIPIIISLHIGCTERQDDEEKKSFSLYLLYHARENIFQKACRSPSTHILLQERAFHTLSCNYGGL